MTGSVRREPLSRHHALKLLEAVKTPKERVVVVTLLHTCLLYTSDAADE